MRTRQRARHARLRRYALRAVTAVVLALTASLLTARAAHDVDGDGHRPATAGEGPGTHVVSLAH